jgi:putative NIF3 family GTP cyclohydrolase 1 type 2
VAAVRAAHPYEAPAVDVYEVQQAATRQGYGAVGDLPGAEPMPAFLDRVSQQLGAASLRWAGNPDAQVRRVAVCGGSGMHFMRQALASGADAFVTADVTYHRFFEALDAEGGPRMALIDAGHYETEAITEALLADHLAAHVEGLEAVRTETRTSPMNTWIPRDETDPRA